jgi:type VI secretion system protein ImpM
MGLALYGKLPALGDFVGRGLAGADREAIDAWLAEGLMRLQQRSERWLEAYLVSPVWQFVIPAGRLCEQAVGGALMPSVDRVGRYFPLFVAFAMPMPLQRGALVRDLGQLARTLPSALHEGLDPDRLLARIDGLLPALWPDAELGPDGEQMLAGFQPEGPLSLWWSLPGPSAPFRFLRHRGRCDAELFVSLFEGG